MQAAGHAEADPKCAELAPLIISVVIPILRWQTSVNIENWSKRDETKRRAAEIADPR